MTACCKKADCKRRQPYKVRQEPFTLRWVLLTRYTDKGDGLIRASEKHDIHEELLAALADAGWTPPWESS